MEIDGQTPGRYRTWLKFKAGDQSFDVPVEAEVSGAGRVFPGVASVPGSVAPVDLSALPEPPEATPSPLAPVIPFDWSADPRLPKGVQVSHITTTSAIIEWPASLSPATRFRVDMRQLQIGPDGKLQVTWLQPTGIPIEARDKNYAAILTGLHPGQPWTVRIVPLQANGEAGQRLFTVEFLTPFRGSLPGRFPRPSLLQWLLIALGALLAWQGWQRWRHRRAF
ncbi:MAG: fibronectin type III domain-containing protein [Chthoniobacter sp.]